jgi:hypothetical protein
MAVGTVAYYVLARPARRTVKDLNAADRARNPTIIDTTYRVANDTEDSRTRQD